MNTRKVSGFTIIEVVLVLAIAALIFLAIFMSFPVLQRNQRDAARKQDVTAVAASLNEYKQNNKATFASLNKTAVRQYVGTTNRYDIDNDSYLYVYPAHDATTTFNANTPQAGVPRSDIIFIYLGRNCGTKSADGTQISFDVNNSPKQGLVVTAFENNGDMETVFCQDI